MNKCLKTGLHCKISMKIVSQLLRVLGYPYHLFCGIGPQPKLPRHHSPLQHSQFHRQQHVHLLHVRFDATTLCIACENAIVSPYKPFKATARAYPTLKSDNTVGASADCFHCFVGALIASCFARQRQRLKAFRPAGLTSAVLVLCQRSIKANNNDSLSLQQTKEKPPERGLLQHKKPRMPPHSDSTAEDNLVVYL